MKSLSLIKKGLNVKLRSEEEDGPYGWVGEVGGRYLVAAIDLTPGTPRARRRSERQARVLVPGEVKLSSEGQERPRQPLECAKIKHHCQDAVYEAGTLQGPVTALFL